MGYIVGYEIHCKGCGRDIIRDVVFLDHEMCARCPKCGIVARYPHGIHPTNLPVVTEHNGRHQCDRCGLLADFGRPWSNSWQLRCTTCLLADATKFLEGHLRASSAKDVRIMGATALAVGVPLAALTAFLAVIETGWFVLTGLIALPLLALAANYLLRSGKVAAGTAEDAVRSQQMLDRLRDETLTEVDKLAVIGLSPGGLWSQKFPAELLKHPQHPARH